MDKLSLNNQIVLMRKPINQATVHVIRQLIKKKKVLANKYPKKADALQEQIAALKTIKKDEVSKFALMNKKSLSEGMSDGLHLDANGKVLLRLATHNLVMKSVSVFRERYPNWEKEVPLLLQVLGVKSKKKNKQQKEKKSNADGVGEEIKDDVAVTEGVERSEKNIGEATPEKEESSQSSSEKSEEEEDGKDDENSEEGNDEQREDERESSPESDCILRIKKGPKKKSQRTKSISSPPSSKKEERKTRTAKTSIEVDNKGGERSRVSSPKKPCFVVTDKVCGAAEIRKLQLDQLDSEEIPVSKNNEGKNSKDFSEQTITAPKDSFFLLEDGGSEGEEEEDNVREEKKENFNSVQCHGGLNRRQRRNVIFGREEKVRPNKYSGRPQPSTGTWKQYLKGQQSRSYPESRESPRMDTVHKGRGETNMPESSTVKEDSSVLHPSWAAKRKLNQQTVSAFQGKKIKFDEE